MARHDPKAPETNEILDAALKHVMETVGGMIEETGRKLSKKLGSGFS